MIEINDIDEYVALKTIENYCFAQHECDNCNIRNLCDHMGTEPRNWITVLALKDDEGDSK